MFLVAGCGGDPPLVPDAGSDASVDASTDGGPVDAPMTTDGGGCVEATVETWFLDNYDDVSVRYGVRIQPDVGGDPYHLYLELRRIGEAPFVGTFPLGTGDDGNYGGCAHCLVAFYGAMFDRGFFASSGTLTLAQDPFDLALDFVLDDIELVEVTIGGDLTSTPVPGGGCIHIERAEVDRTFGPPGWTCAEAEFEDGVECDCECGILDRDCLDPSLPIDGCASGQLCLPIARGVIGPFFGDSVCANDCDTASGVTCPTDEVCVQHAFGDVCVRDPAEIDRIATIGARCADGALYCAIDSMRVATGYCDLFARGDNLCQPRCSVDADCDTSIFEHCYVTNYDASSGVEVPFGYCALRYPAGWTCSGADYEDGALCHCGCGVTDSDCYDLALPVSGCAAGETCVDAVCTPP